MGRTAERGLFRRVPERLDRIFLSQLSNEKNAMAVS
jgi:hypothetical protein